MFHPINFSIAYHIKKQNLSTFLLVLLDLYWKHYLFNNLNDIRLTTYGCSHNRMVYNRFSKKHIENILYEGDCIEIMARLPDKSIDMILCDLPYGITQNKWDVQIPFDALWKEYERVIKNSGVIVLTSQGLFTAQLIMSNPKLFKYKLVWIKSKATNFLNAKKQPLRKYEDICVFYRNSAGRSTYNPQMTIGKPYNKGIRKGQSIGTYGKFGSTEIKSDGPRYPVDVIDFKTAENEGEVFHPSQKPIALGRYLVRTYSKKGEIVLDNAFGSGSFLLAAAIEGRRFVGIELNQEIFLNKTENVDLIKIARKRILEAMPKIQIRVNISTTKNKQQIFHQ